MTLRAWIHATAFSLFTVVVAAGIVLLLVAARLHAVSNQLADGSTRIEHAVALSRALAAHRQIIRRAALARPNSEELRSARQSAKAELRALVTGATAPPDQRELAELAEVLRAYFATSDRAAALSPRPAGEEDRLENAYQEAREAAHGIVVNLLSEVAELTPETRFLQSTAFASGGGALILALCGCLAVVLSLKSRLVYPVEALMRHLRDAKHVPAPVRLTGEFGALARALDERERVIDQQQRAQMVFVSGVAHDLRTPLAALRLHADIVARVLPADPDPRLIRSTAHIRAQVERLNRQIDDLLDAARIQSGEIHLQVERIDLADTVRAAAALFEGQERHPVVIRGSDTLWIQGDATRLHQVIVNLVSNAIKYSPEGGAVEVTLTSDARRVELAVTDSGVGIPSEDLAVIFQPFRRGRADALRIPGTGLGLSVSRKIVEAHGGELTVESSPGRGSTFRVRLHPASQPRDSPRDDRPRDAHSDLVEVT